MKNPSRVIRAEWWLVLCMLIQSFFPLLVHQGASGLNSYQFFAYSIFLSIPVFLGISLIRGELRELFHPKVVLYLIGVSFAVVLLPNLLIFYAAPHSSGISTSLLTQSELIYATLICWFLGDRISNTRVLAVLTILMGTALVLYDGQLTSLNGADLILFLAPVSYVFGNIWAKKALNHVSWATVLLFRSALAGLILLLFLPLQGGWVSPSSEAWASLLVMGIVISSFAKILWYWGLKEFDVVKATSIIMTYPAASFVFAILFFHELPNLWELAGFSIVLLGLILLIREKANVVHVGLRKF